MGKTYYTYLHCKPDGVPFYVGKGSGKRAFILNRRNTFYRNTLAKLGKENIKVFIFECESEKEAFENEIRDIAQFRLEGIKLANITNGGEGVSGLSKSVSEEQRAKLSLAGKGNKNALGWKHTKESMAKMLASREHGTELRDYLVSVLVKANSKKVLCVDTGEIFDSATSATRILGIKDKSSITKVCRGIHKTAYGYSFQYL